jgi:hypothetical protein
MKINLYTDAPKHNLALMKLSTYHKESGDEVLLNMPLFKCDYSYASVIFDKNTRMFNADEYGGPAFLDAALPQEIESLKPDYSLFGIDYSLGYTFRPCYNSCGFCKVPKMNHPDTEHHSIWEFHDSRFKKIKLLNNNTFQDAKWKETFEEIWDANLKLIDEGGYDLRIIDDEKAETLRKTRFQGKIHFAWDRMQDEHLIIEGLKCLKKYFNSNVVIYVIVGYDTTIEQDLHRCDVIRSFGFDPYIMIYKSNMELREFKRFVMSYSWRKYKTISEGYKQYIERIKR